MKKLLKIGKIIFDIIFVLFIVAAAFLTINSVIAQISGNIPSVFGYSIYRVVSGSMEPEIHVGDILLSRAADASEVSVGDVIAFDGGKQYPGLLVTHKVIKAPYDDNGQIMLQTKGVANNYEDDPIPAESVKSIIVCKLPFLTWIYKIFMSPFGIIIIVALLGFIFFDELKKLFKKLTAKKSQDQSET